MFHVKHVMSAAAHSGVELDGKKIDLLRRYGEWLADEGIRAGGLGPGERDRIEQRHLADSLLFAGQFPEGAEEVLDLGSGVGLPGIPLAIVMPETGFTLIDRSGRRVDLCRRVTRILGLENCRVVKGDIETVGIRGDVVVSRASLPPDRLLPLLPDLMKTPGVAIVAGSWTRRPGMEGWATIEIPPDVLDRPIWLLMMRRE